MLMKVKCRLGIAMGVMLMLGAAQGADWNERWRYDRNTADNFTAPDCTLDLFGTWANKDRFGADDDNFGGGLGLTFFFTRVLGISADSYIEEWKLPYRANASLIARVPVGQSGLAPYAFGGGGRQWKYVPQYTAHAGAGVQLKLNAKTALFGDWRRVFPETTDDHHLVRFGLNLGF
jgi:hypothetical protein